MKKEAWIISVIIIIIVCTLILCGGGRAETYIEYTVQQGDTLWELYESHGSGNARRWIEDVRQVNALGTDWIYPGQALLLEVK